jgi:hypothetical protein
MNLKTTMPFQEKFNVGLRALTNTININYTNQIDFDLTRYTDLRDSIDRRTGVNQFNVTKNGLALQITGWSRRSSTEPGIEQIPVRSLNGLSIIEENQIDYSMLMLSFDRAVSLTSLELGWIEGDNNVSLLALNNREINHFSDKQWPQLLADEWCPAGEYFNLDYKGNSNRVNLCRIISKHWLVGSYNPNLYNYYSNNADQNCKFDRFKLQSVTVSTENIMIKARKFVESRLFRQSDGSQQ